MNIISKKTFSEIQELKTLGTSKRKSARKLKIDIGTIRKYWNFVAPVAQLVDAIDLRSIQCRFESDQGYQEAYVYLLGLYLGDGYINLENKKYKVYKIRITQDSKYPKLIDEHKKAISTVLRCKTNSVKHKNHNCIDVYGYSKTIPYLFPHLGTGRKHLRKLKFKNWQKKLIKINYWFFIRGLIQSDGARYIHTVNTGHKYVKYTFCNSSKDIINIFLYACKLAKLSPCIHKRKALNYKGEMMTGHRYNITFNLRQDTNLLEKYIGVKS